MSRWRVVFLVVWLVRGLHAQDEMTPLCKAAWDGEIAAARAALEHKWPLESACNSRTALMWAAEGGHLEMVDFLLAAGADANAVVGRDEDWTPLRAAGRSGRADVLERILRLTVAPALGAGSWDGSIAHIVALHPDPELVEVLARARVPLDEDSPRVGGTPLHVAAYAGNERIVAALLRHGARVDARGELQRTPLQLAAFAGHREVVRVLLAAGADRELVDRLGRNATHLACEGGHDGVLEELRWDAERGAWSSSLDRGDAHGWTPLSVAAAFGHARCIRGLYGHALDARTVDTQRSALHWACRGGNLHAIEQILDMGVPADERDSSGRLPLELLTSRAPAHLLARLGSAPSAEPVSRAELLALAKADAGDPVVVVRELPGYTAYPEGGIRRAVWSDGLALFAPDDWKPGDPPGQAMRVGRVDPKAVEAALAVCSELGFFDLPDRSEVYMHAGSVRVSLRRGEVRRTIEWDEAFDERGKLPRDCSRRTFEDAWGLMKPELDALVPAASLALEELVPDSRVRGYLPDRSADVPWLR